MKNELKETFLRKYPQYGIVLRMYEEANEVDCCFSTLSKIRLQRFVDYMCSNLAQSSARQYAAKFKAVLNLYSEEVDLPRDYAKILSPKNEKSVSTWLDDSDLDKICKYIPQNDVERTIHAQFLIGAYSGARKSDFVRFGAENISKGYISYVSQKTKIRAVVPLKPIVEELLQRENGKKEYCEHTFNDTIRAICKKCGITQRVKVFKAGKELTGEKWQFITSHTARKSFASNLYLRGADLYSISKMMGHSSVTMTESYICCGLRDQSPEVLAYFS